MPDCLHSVPQATPVDALFVRLRHHMGSARIVNNEDIVFGPPVQHTEPQMQDSPCRQLQVPAFVLESKVRSQGKGKHSSSLSGLMA